MLIISTFALNKCQHFYFSQKYNAEFYQNLLYINNAYQNCKCPHSLTTKSSLKYNYRSANTHTHRCHRTLNLQKKGGDTI